MSEKELIESTQDVEYRRVRKEASKFRKISNAFMENIELTGEIITKEYNEVKKIYEGIVIKDIEIEDSNVNFKIEKTTTPYIKVIAQESLFDELNVNIQNNKLVIKGVKGHKYLTEYINIEIGLMEEINSLDISYCDGYINGDIFTEDVKISGSGNSCINFSDMNVKRFAIQLSDACDYSFNDIIAENVEMGLSGQCHIEMDNLICQSKVSLDFSGDSKYNTNTISSENIEFCFSGSSKAILKNVNVLNDILIKSSGFSNFELEGITERLICKLTGSSEVDSFDLTCNETIVESSGSTKTKVNVLDKLSVDISGASVVKYKGRPVIEKMETSGSAKVEWIE